MSNPRRKLSLGAKAMLGAVYVMVGMGLLYFVFGETTKYDRTTPVDTMVEAKLRELQQGAEQFFSEHPGVSSVSTDTLVGTSSSQYLKPFATVAGESYASTILQGHPITASGISGARTITYAP